MRVCIVEDDPIMLDHVADMVEGLGYEAMKALDVDSGLRLIERNAPDAVIVDILMPDRDGLNLIMDIRPRLETLRVVAITGGGRLGAGPILDMARGLGAHATLVKPFTSADLEAALQPA